MNTAAILGPEGRIAARLEQYEQRPEQLQMAEAVERAIEEQRHLLVEAGTGVGKSFAYLVPAILAAGAAQEDESGVRRKIIVSTNTISLQEQLIYNDIPFLNAVLPVEFSAVLVKGRGNYISLRRLNGAVERAGSMFSQPEQLSQLQQITHWSLETTDGSTSELEFRPLPAVWDEVRSEHGNCLGKACREFQHCFYYKARRRVWNADILVVNHALFFSDLALRRDGASILPDYDVVIFDEAHTIEQVAGDHMGISVSNGQFEYLLNKLYNQRSQKGLLVHHQLADAQEKVSRIRYLCDDFFADLPILVDQQANRNGRVRERLPITNLLSPAMRQLGAELHRAGQKIKKEEDRIELIAASERCGGLADSLDIWVEQKHDDSVYWVETAGRRKQIQKLNCVPIEINTVLRDELFNVVKTVVLTSATLSVGKQDFNFVKNRLGLSECDALKLGSPFDYSKQAKLILPKGMPDPSGPALAYEDAVCEKIKHYVSQTDGRAFVLFTSYTMLRHCAEQLALWLTQQNLALFSQGDGVPRSQMLERYRKTKRAVLFGTDSFWQGVDVPGEALQNVIITKLPFSVPDHPLLEARVEKIRERGGNPFMEYQVPEAVIKLKQGFGRLIRSKQDTGQVVILDPRVRTKPYGRQFLDSLPDCQRVIDHV